MKQRPRTEDRDDLLRPRLVDMIDQRQELVRLRYEYGSKVSVAPTLDEGFVVSRRSFPGNPYDGHTLNEALK